MNAKNEQLKKILNTFPKGCHDILHDMINDGGHLNSAGCDMLLAIMGISLEQLMLRLLPLAKLYGIVPVSDFYVGAVAKGIPDKDDNDYALYLGANIEFAGQCLNQSIHAEQCVIMNARLKGVKQIRCIAVSARPCGHCRQFIKELEKGDSIIIITSADNNQGYETRTLSELLPHGFGPHDLGMENGMMGETDQDQNLTLMQANDDPLIKDALYAANKSYAPYTGNFAGCAVQDKNGEVYIGPYAENAAFNPGISPLQSAICNMNMTRIEKKTAIRRVILVEKKTESSQYHTTRQLLKSFAPYIDLEYFEVI